MDEDELVRAVFAELSQGRDAQSDAEADARVIRACTRPRSREEQRRLQDQIDALDAERAWYRLGVVLTEQGQWVEAAHWLRKAAERDFGDSTIRLARVLERLGHTHEASHWRTVAEEMGLCDGDLDDTKGSIDRPALILLVNNGDAVSVPLE